MSGKIRIGISGWRYPLWRKVFYPPGLAQSRELQFASRALPTIEINGAFYGLPRPTSYARWYADTPEGFVFSVKAPRYVTHILRLNHAETAIANFLASGLFHLKEKLGPILWQFPPGFRFNPGQFESFLQLLPRDTASALALARRHDAGMRGRTCLEIDRKRPCRHAVEIRNESFIDEAFIHMLRRHRVALVVADTAGKWPLCEDVTAGFVYIRLHGAEELYVGGYADSALQDWAARITAWSRGGQPDAPRLIVDRAPRARKSRDVYCYFDNDIQGRAPVDALRLIDRLRLEPG